MNVNPPGPPRENYPEDYSLDDEKYYELGLGPPKRLQPFPGPAVDLDETYDSIELENILDTEVDTLIDNFMTNDENIRALHPNRPPPEKGFLERHKVLGVFLIGASAILSLAIGAAGFAIAFGLPIVLTPMLGPVGGPIFIALWVSLGAPATLSLLGSFAVGVGFLTYFLTEKTFATSIHTRETVSSLKWSLRRANVQPTQDLEQRVKPLFRQMGRVRTERGGRSRSVAEIDFLVKYSNLPDAHKRELLTGFHRQRQVSQETPATQLRREEREFESILKLEDAVFKQRLAESLGLNENQLEKNPNETWKYFYQRIFELVQENHLYQSLPEARRNEIEQLTNEFSATKLFHALQDIEAVEAVVRRDASKMIGESTLEAIRNAPQEADQISLPPNHISDWLKSETVINAIETELTALSRTWTYKPIIPLTPVLSVTQQ